jgi:hypothetical protein
MGMNASLTAVVLIEYNGRPKIWITRVDKIFQIDSQEKTLENAD